MGRKKLLKKLNTYCRNKNIVFEIKHSVNVWSNRLDMTEERLRDFGDQYEKKKPIIQISEIGRAWESIMCI